MAGLPLGVRDDFAYASCRVALEPGDSVLAFTDGVTEAKDVNDAQLTTRGVYAAVPGDAPGDGLDGRLCADHRTSAA